MFLLLSELRKLEYRLSETDEIFMQFLVVLIKKFKALMTLKHAHDNYT